MMALPLVAGQAAMQILPIHLPSTGGSSSQGQETAVNAGRIFFHHVDHLSPSLQAVKELKRPVGHMVCADRSVVVAVEENKCLLPPNFSRYVAWGYADHSIRLVPHDSDKALMVCETPFHHQEILTCVCPTGRTVVTGGANTVVTVWDLGKKQFTVRQHLYGHTEAVTCLAASAGYQILVSGSRDRTAVVWDLSRLTFIRQLGGHNAPLAAIDVNDLTGDIATCSGTWLHLWSINGDPLASVNTLVGQMLGRSQHILCVRFSQHNEWDPMNVILTGSTDGVVRMWSLDYVQVPKDETLPQQPAVQQQVAVAEESEEESPDEETALPAPLQRQGSVCSLPISCGSENEPGPDSTSSPVSPSAETNEKLLETEQPLLRSSRSDSSLNGTFEMISESEVRESAIHQTASASSIPSGPLNPQQQPGVVKKSRHVLKEGPSIRFRFFFSIF